MSKAKVVARGGKGALDRSADVIVANAETDASVRPVLPNGTRVRVSHGDVPRNLPPQDTRVIGERSAAGIQGRIDGAAYVAQGGPNKGRLVQPIREEGTGDVLAVPAERLTAGSGGHSAARAGWTRKYEDAYEKIFGGGA